MKSTPILSHPSLNPTSSESNNSEGIWTPADPILYRAGLSNKYILTLSSRMDALYSTPLIISSSTESGRIELINKFEEEVVARAIIYRQTPSLVHFSSTHANAREQFSRYIPLLVQGAKKSPEIKGLDDFLLTIRTSI